MKLLAYLIFTLLLFDPGKTSQINSLKTDAKKAFEAGDFKSAISKYKYLIDSLGVTEEEVRMNLAHAYFKTNDTLKAMDTYKPLASSNDNYLRSLANQQLGVLTNRQGKLEDALNYFKQSLKAAPANEDARYDYEMVKKKLDEKQKNDQNKDNKDNKDQNKDKKDQKDKQDQKDKDQQNKDQQNKDKKDQDQKDQKDKQDPKDQKDQQKKDQEKKDQEKKDAEKKKADDQKKQDQEDKKDIPPSVSEKLKDMQMSEEKAKMILEAMRNQEKQYLQQNKRKATKPKEKGKPDW